MAEQQELHTLCRLCDHILVSHILWVLNEGTMSGLADTISVFNFKQHVAKQASVTAATATLIFPETSVKVVANGGT
jgi:hypothetical protein